MNADELRRIAYQIPFKPFRVRLVSGESLNIERSLRTTVWEDRVLFGVKENATNGVSSRLRVVPLRDITVIEVTSSA